MMNIAIDGPSGAGKSTIAKALAKELNIKYLDTGAMYRGVAYFLDSMSVDVNDETSVLASLDNISMDIVYNDGVPSVIINGKDVTPFIREHKISMMASTVSKISAVRLKLVEIQRLIASKSDCVLDGRDIGSYVLPNASIKFFLTASAEVRAKRRFEELQEKNSILTYEEVLKDIILRDNQDTSRAFAPLKATKESIIIDTSNLSIAESIRLFLSHICK